MTSDSEYYTAPYCSECNETVQEDQRYCHNCGAFLGSETVAVNIFNNKDLRSIFIFYFLYLFVCLLVKHSESFTSYDQLFWIEIILAALTIGFAWQNRQAIKPILKFNNFSWSLLAGVLAIAVVGSVVISLSVRELNISFFETEVSYFKAFRLYMFPVLIMFYSIALMPALFEELAFRGIMYNYCAGFLDERLVVVVTAFLFAIMHLSLISLVWLIPFGMFLGNLRRKYNTIWYGILFHFTFNFTACIIDLYRQGELVWK